jgi:hypothetical protein
LALVAVGNLISDNLFQCGVAARIIGYSLLSLWLIIGIFVLYKMLSCLSLPRKIQKLSQKIAQIDKEIAEELANSNF